MKVRQILSLFIIISLVLNQSISFAFDDTALENLKKINESLNNLIKSLQGLDKDNKDLEKNKEKSKIYKRSINLDTKEKTLTLSHSDVSDSVLSQCELMKKNKEDLVSSAGKKILAGAAVGAAVGAVAAGKERRSEGAILGALAGMIAATGYELWDKKDLFEEDAIKVAKKVGYKPEQGVYLKIREIKLNSDNVKLGDNLRVILRVDYLFPEAIDSEKVKNSSSFNILGSLVKGSDSNEKPVVFHEITIKAYYLKENQEIFVAEETYNIPPGSNPFLYVFPICGAYSQGEHKVKFVVERGGVKDEKIITFNRI